MNENLIASRWNDYEIIDTGDGMKLERWKDVTLARPDPQIIWKKKSPEIWKKADARYQRSNSGGGAWTYNKKLPEKWTVDYTLEDNTNLKIFVEPTGFKHTGIFPEQAANWEWMYKVIKNRVASGKEVKVLNLFGYTGGATLACASAGACVCHVDASKGMVARAKENIQLSGLGDRNVRYIVDDAFKFTAREIRRNNKYDCIIMDPPSYGRGPGGEIWKLEDNIFDFVSESIQCLSDDPLFFLINSYTTGFSSTVMANILTMLITSKRGGCVKHGDLLLPIKTMSKPGAEGYLPCGTYGAWMNQ